MLEFLRDKPKITQIITFRTAGNLVVSLNGNWVFKQS